MIECKECGYPFEGGICPECGTPSEQVRTDNVVTRRDARTMAQAAPADDTKPRYYLAVNGLQEGPFSKQDILETLQRGGGSLNAEMLAWKKGMDNWGKLSEFEEFADFFPDATQ